METQRQESQDESQLSTWKSNTDLWLKLPILIFLSIIFADYDVNDGYDWSYWTELFGWTLVSIVVGLYITYDEKKIMIDLFRSLFQGLGMFSIFFCISVTGWRTVVSIVTWGPFSSDKINMKVNEDRFLGKFIFVLGALIFNTSVMVVLGAHPFKEPENDPEQDNFFIRNFRKYSKWIFKCLFISQIFNMADIFTCFITIVFFLAIRPMLDKYRFGILTHRLVWIITFLIVSLFGIFKFHRFNKNNDNEKNPVNGLNSNLDGQEEGLNKNSQSPTWKSTDIWLPILIFFSVVSANYGECGLYDWRQWVLIFGWMQVLILTGFLTELINKKRLKTLYRTLVFSLSILAIFYSILMIARRMALTITRRGLVSSDEYENCYEWLPDLLLELGGTIFNIAIMVKLDACPWIKCVAEELDNAKDHFIVKNFKKYGEKRIFKLLLVLVILSLAEIFATTFINLANIRGSTYELFGFTIVKLRLIWTFIFLGVSLKSLYEFYNYNKKKKEIEKSSNNDLDV